MNKNKGLDLMPVWTLYAGIVVGSILLNLCVSFNYLDLKTLSINEYCISLMNNQDMTGLLVEVIIKRVKQLLAIVILILAFKTRIGFSVVSFGIGVVFGGLISTQCANYGMVGMVYVLAALLPHFLLYVGGLIISYFTLLKKEDMYRSYGSKYDLPIRITTIIVLITGGVVLETYLSPIIIEFIFKNLN